MRRFAFVLLLAACAVFAQSAPFNPQASANVAVTASAQTLTLPVTSIPAALQQYVITSTASPSTGCTQPAFFTANGTTATTGNGMPVLPNSSFVISMGKSTTAVSVIGGGTGCTFYITVGVGQ